MKKYIPKTKDDIQSVEYLQSLPFYIIKPDVPSLLNWLKDLHWDVSHGIAEYLIPNVNEIKSDLFGILNADDDEWKFNILVILVRMSPNKLDQELISIIKRIAEHPTKGEIEEEVDKQAREIIIKNNKLK